MGNFLYCNPSVYVIGKEYEIIVNLNKFGLCYVNIDGEIFYENNSGVLPSEKNIAKFL